MKLPTLFSREKSLPAAREAQDRAEKLLAESFRMLSEVCAKMADYVEAQRLAKAGFEEQGKFLERLDPASQHPGAQPKDKKPSR